MSTVCSQTREQRRCVLSGLGAEHDGALRGRSTRLARLPQRLGHFSTTQNITYELRGSTSQSTTGPQAIVKRVLREPKGIVPVMFRFFL